MNYGENISLQIMLANKTYHQQLYKILEDVDIHHHFHIILVLIRQGGKSTQKVLCEQLQIEKSNMVAIVDLLEKKGYITREMNYRDRRGKMIVCTQKAKDIVSTFENAFRKMEDSVAHDITWQEMHNFLYVLRRINHNLMILGNQKGVAVK